MPPPERKRTGEEEEEEEWMQEIRLRARIINSLVWILEGGAEEAG